MVEMTIHDYVNLNKDSDLGLVTTPPKTVEYIIDKLSPFKKDERILDPCVGPGIFVKKLVDRGVNPEQIEAFDINPEYQPIIEELGVTFKHKDYLLSINPFSYNQYDVVLGNPPYLNKDSKYIKKNREKLKKIYNRVNAHETYSMFIVNSIWRLKNGGRLGFITSDSFLTLNTHTRLRKFILNTCRIKEILLTPENLFDEQNVSTKTLILILEKCSGERNMELRLNNQMGIIPRVENEKDYNNPKKVINFKQRRYHSLPFKLFFLNVEKEIIDLFEQAPRLKRFISGHIGMHTHNNRKYIAAIKGTELAKTFQKRNKKIKNAEKRYKVIPRDRLDSPEWKPYLKRGGSTQYYRPIIEALDWKKESRSVYDIPNNVPFEKEGIIISGVSSRFAVRYMPPGCYWDSNKAMGFIIKDNAISINYALGVLNSSLYNYLMKGIINNTNSIQITGIRALPFITPSQVVKEKIERLTSNIINNMKNNPNYNYVEEQKEIDNLVFNYYQEKFNFPEKLKEKLDKKHSIYNKDS